MYLVCTWLCQAINIHLAIVNHMAQPGVYTSYQDSSFSHQYQKVCAVVPVWHVMSDVILVVVRHAVSTTSYVWECDLYGYFCFPHNLTAVCYEQHNACKYACAYNNPFCHFWVEKETCVTDIKVNTVSYHYSTCIPIVCIIIM